MEKIATVKDLIDHLKNNFKETDMLCFFDDGGAWCELVHLPKSLIGDWMFRRVEDKKACELKKYPDIKNIIENNYRFVKDGVVIY